MSDAGLQADTLTRRPRGNDGPTLEEIEARQGADGGEVQPTPEEALAEAQRQVEETNRAREEERTARIAAERERDEARRNSTESQSARVTDQESAILNAIEAGKSAKIAAHSKLRAAREAGDFDAETAAFDEITAANLKLTRATEAKTALDAWKAKQPKPGETRTEQPEAGKPTTEAQRWLDAHPRYSSDSEYRADANTSHQLAIENGCAEGSRAYIDYIENRMTRLYGDGHGQVGAPPRGQQKPNGGNVNQDRRGSGRSASSTAAPPSRGGSERSVGGGFEYRDPSGSVLRLVQGADGKETVQGTIPGEWVEAAKWAKMTPATYAVEQLKIQQEIKEGGLSGLTYGESGTYR